MTEPEQLELLLAPIRATFHAKRRARVGIIEQISRGLDAYMRAADTSTARELCQAHGLPLPPLGTHPDRLAEELVRLVQTLPELRAGSLQPDPRNSQEPSRALDHAGMSDAVQTAGPSQKSRSIGTPSGDASPDTPRTSTPESWPNLQTAATQTQIIIVGGPPHLERLKVLPIRTLENVEWIDTTRQGTHAIGNLERRIRDHRIGAIVVLEGLVQHRHTDPLISAARSIDLPIAFAGKGGRTAIVQALKELESKLSSQHRPNVTKR